MEIKNRIKELRQVKASELLPNPKNWRTHPKSQVSALKGVLDEIGYADALIAYETEEGLMLIDGHLRAETTPDMEVPVLVTDLDEEEASMLLATLDPLAAMATANDEGLKRLLDSITTNNDEINELLRFIDNGITPGFEPLGMWEPDIANVSSILSTDEEILARFVVRCPMDESDNLKSELEALVQKYSGATVA